MRKISRINGTEFPSVVFEKIALQEKTEEKNNCEMEGTLAQMLKSRRFDVNIIFTYNLALCLLFPRLLLRLVNMGFQWFSVTLCYYGLSFASTNLSQHVWTDFLLRNHQPDSEGRQICKLQLVLVYDKYILLMSYNGC